MRYFILEVGSLYWDETISVTRVNAIIVRKHSKVYRDA